MEQPIPFASSPKGRISLLSVSPPGRKQTNAQAAKIINLNESKKAQRSQKLKIGISQTPHQYSRRKQWVLNPFRQKDEDEVLSKRNHNSRRWSHVFPQGEIEFKRHTGPNFKSVSLDVIKSTFNHHVGFYCLCHVCCYILLSCANLPYCLS